MYKGLTHHHSDTKPLPKTKKKKKLRQLTAVINHNVKNNTTYERNKLIG